MTFEAWAIECEIDDKKFFISNKWQFVESVPQQVLGCKICLFNSRDVARVFKHKVEKTVGNARLVKVSVDVREIG